MAKLTNVDNGSQSDKRTDFDTQAHRKFCCNEPATDKQAGKKGRGKWKKRKGGEWATTSSECPGDRQRLTGIQQLVIRCCTDSWGRTGLGSRHGAGVDHDKRCLTKFNNRWQLQFTAWQRRPGHLCKYRNYNNDVQPDSPSTTCIAEQSNSPRLAPRLTDLEGEKEVCRGRGEKGAE